jgi:hypothetical protein
MELMTSGMDPDQVLQVAALLELAVQPQSYFAFVRAANDVNGMAGATRR